MSYPPYPPQPPQQPRPPQWGPPQQQWPPPPQRWPQPQGQWGQQQWQRPPGPGPGPQPNFGYNQQQWGPPPGHFPPPRKSGGGLGKFLLILFGVGLIVFVAAMLVRGAAGVTEPPLPPRSTPPASPSNGTTPVETPDPDLNPGLPPQEWPALPEPNSTDPDWVTLQQSVLYPIPIPTIDGCPTPERARDMADLERLAGEQMECIQEAWRPVLRANGLAAHEIPIYYYEGSSVKTPCGRVSAPALYCSAQGGAIYFGEETLNGAKYHDFGVKDMAGHEYTHHLQAIAGMFEAEYRIDEGNEAARRLELQATCVGYAMIANDTSFEMNGRIYRSFEPYLRAVIEDGIHGSKDSVAYWGLRGLYSVDVGNCNTWTAESADVD